MDWIDKLSDEELETISGWLDKMGSVFEQLKRISEKAAERRQAKSSDSDSPKQSACPCTIPQTDHCCDRTYHQGCITKTYSFI